MNEIDKINTYCFALIKACRETNAETMTLTQTNVTYLNKNIGSWEITVKKV